jgi:hypothetical protein
MMKEPKSATSKRKKPLSKKDNPPKLSDTAPLIDETLTASERVAPRRQIFPLWASALLPAA